MLWQTVDVITRKQANELCGGKAPRSGYLKDVQYLGRRASVVHHHATEMLPAEFWLIYRKHDWEPRYVEGKQRRGNMTQKLNDAQKCGWNDIAYGINTWKESLNDKWDGPLAWALHIIDIGKDMTGDYCSGCVLAAKHYQEHKSIARKERGKTWH